MSECEYKLGLYVQAIYISQVSVLDSFLWVACNSVLQLGIRRGKGGDTSLFYWEGSDPMMDG